MLLPGKNLSLFADLPEAATTTKRRRESAPDGVRQAPLIQRQQTNCLWLAIRFSNLALDVLDETQDASHGVAVIAEQHGRYVVSAANSLAGQHGVRAGLSLNAAYALLPSLQTRPRDYLKEHDYLVELAVWASRFTSQLSVVEPDALLLEINASKKLFAGIDGVVAAVEGDLQQRELAYRLAVTPTPLGALWLAHPMLTEPSVILTDAAILSDQLGRLPLAVTDWPVKQLQTLDGMGVRTVRDCARLPRDGFTRRFGRARRAELDRAFNRAADPRTSAVVPQRFSASLELPQHSQSLRLIEIGANRLLAQLAEFLRTRQMALESFELELRHPDAAASTLRVGFVGPTRDAARLRTVLAERLECLQLVAPVSELCLLAKQLLVLAGDDGDLFRHDAASYDWPQLVERLRARLGVDSVHGLCMVPEHRPELAWRYVEPGEQSEPLASKQRPLWLLSEPVKLRTRRSRPQFEGALQLLSQAERIETGWWDGKDVVRDYYHAINTNGLRIWIYRRRRAPKDWYLHGVFA